MPEIRATACNRDCPDACTIHATVEGGRVTSLRGDPDDPVTRGFLCERTSRFLGRQYAADRFLTPRIRRGGRGPDGVLEPASWDEALDLVAERLLAVRAESGPEAILHYQSGGSLGILKAAAALLFESFGPCAVKHGDICSGAGEAAQERDFGVSESHDLLDLHNSRTILLWGKNPHTSGVHLVPVLREAQERGAIVVGVDPVRTRAAGLCDLFVQPRPGGDFGLVMACVRWLIDHDRIAPDAAERCDHLDAFLGRARERDLAGWADWAGVDPGVATTVAETYAAGPSALLVGWGLARRHNGSRTVRAMDALGAVGGNLGVPGGGVSFYFGRRSAFDLDFVRGAAAAPRTFSEARLGPELLAADPPVRALWVTAGNPVAMLPESGTVREALRRIGFVVVVDTHPTDTTDLADVVLPTLTLLEDDDLVGAYGNHWLRESRPVVPPPRADGRGDGPRHELHLLQDLAGRLGVGDALAGSIEDWKRRVTRRLEAAGAGLDALRAGPVRNPFAAEVLFADGRVPTGSGRVQLLDDEVAPPHETTPEWPLLLLATSTGKAQSSQWSSPPPSPPEVRVHPDAAAGLADGARGVLRSAVAALQVTVRHDERVRPDVALMAKGGQLRDGACANLLIRAAETDEGHGAAYYDEPVRLEAST